MWLTKKKSFPFLFCLFRGSEGVCWLPCWRWFWWQGKRCTSSPVSSSVEREYFQKVCWKRRKELRPKCISQLFTLSWWVQNQFQIETDRVFFSKVTHIPALFFEIVPPAWPFVLPLTFLCDTRRVRDHSRLRWSAREPLSHARKVSHNMHLNESVERQKPTSKIASHFKPLFPSNLLIPQPRSQ